MCNKNERKDNDYSIIKINKWDGSAAKNTLDDAIRNILIRKHNYIENFTLIDGRLSLCGISVAMASVALLWDYIYPFPLSRAVLIGCVSMYFALMGILTLYTTYKEKGIFTVAIQRDPTGYNPNYTWEASSFMRKFDDKYNLILSIKNEATGSLGEINTSKSVSNFIDIHGIIVPELLENFITKMHENLKNQHKDK